MLNTHNSSLVLQSCRKSTAFLNPATHKPSQLIAAISENLQQASRLVQVQELVSILISFSEGCAQFFEGLLLFLRVIGCVSFEMPCELCKSHLAILVQVMGFHDGFGTLMIHSIIHIRHGVSIFVKCVSTLNNHCLDKRQEQSLDHARHV